MKVEWLLSIKYDFSLKGIFKDTTFCITSINVSLKNQSIHEAVKKPLSLFQFFDTTFSHSVPKLLLTVLKYLFVTILFTLSLRDFSHKNEHNHSFLMKCAQAVET